MVCEAISLEDLCYHSKADLPLFCRTCPHMFTKTGQEHHGSLVGENQKSERWCRCVLVVWEVIESKGKQDVASEPPESKMVGSLMSDLCSSKQLPLLSEAKNMEGLMPPPLPPDPHASYHW